MEKGFEDLELEEDAIDEAIEAAGDFLEGSGEVIDLTAEEIEDLRVRTKSVVSTISDSFVELGGLLYKTFASKAYESWGWETFREYCSFEIQRSERSCRYLMSIHHALEFRLTEDEHKERLKALGWTKASRVAPYINDANAEEILDNVEGFNVEEVQGYMQKHKPKKKKDEDVVDKDEQVRRLELDMVESQFRVLKEAMSLAGEIGNTKSKGQQLEYISLEFLSGQSQVGAYGKEERIELHLKSLKQLTGEVYMPEVSDPAAVFGDTIKEALDSPEMVREAIGEEGDGDVTLMEFLAYWDVKRGDKNE